MGDLLIEHLHTANYPQLTDPLISAIEWRLPPDARTTEEIRYIPSLGFLGLAETDGPATRVVGFRPVHAGGEEAGELAQGRSEGYPSPRARMPGVLFTGTGVRLYNTPEAAKRSGRAAEGARSIGVYACKLPEGIQIVDKRRLSDLSGVRPVLRSAVQFAHLVRNAIGGRQRAIARIDESYGPADMVLFHQAPPRQRQSRGRGQAPQPHPAFLLVRNLDLPLHRIGTIASEVTSTD